MKRIEADTLEEAYAKASEVLNCSITKLKYEVIQHPSKGFLGMFKKQAIIIADCMIETAPAPQTPKQETTPAKNFSKPKPQKHHAPKKTAYVEEKRVEKEEISVKPTKVFKEKTDSIVDNFFEQDVDVSSAIDEIRKDLNAIFSKSCFEIDTINVSQYDEKTVLIEFDGEDSALLIGKEGYRYKALSYMLYNWINAKYNLQLRLEVAEFLANQEEMIRNYVKTICEIVDKNGRAQTKVLDGVLVQIALKELRDIYPDKYVAIRTNRDGGKYVIINSFNK